MTTRKVTFFAIKRMRVGDDWREPGELVPEAAYWKYVDSSIREGYVAPVLVDTLPADLREQVNAYYAARDNLDTSSTDTSATDSADDDNQSVGDIVSDDNSTSSLQRSRKRKTS